MEKVNEMIIVGGMAFTFLKVLHNMEVFESIQMLCRWYCLKISYLIQKDWHWEKSFNAIFELKQTDRKPIINLGKIINFFKFRFKIFLFLKIYQMLFVRRTCQFSWNFQKGYDIPFIDWEVSVWWRGLENSGRSYGKGQIKRSDHSSTNWLCDWKQICWRCWS